MSALSAGPAGVSVAGWIFLAGVVFAAVSIVWTGIGTGISPMPSSRRACDAMIEAAAGAPAGRVVDLGSGWGTLAIRFARACPHRSVIGYELSFVPWLVASLLGRCLKLDNLSFRRQDHRDADLEGAGLLLCFLFRDGMTRLSRRLASRRCPDPERPAWLISNTFALPFHRPMCVLQLADLYRTRIYIYRLADRTGAEPMLSKCDDRPDASHSAPQLRMDGCGVAVRRGD